jgi:hypothetical protein
MKQITVPRPRVQPDPAVESVEDEVARIADLVLKLSALAERYEDTMGRIAPALPSFDEQQARVDAMRAVAERGRRRLTSIGRD